MTLVLLVHRCQAAVGTLLLGILLLLMSGQSIAENRVALVIGNSSYSHAPLQNPLNDAQDMGQLLKSFDFKVTHREDLDKKGMERAIYNFTRKLGKGTVGLFYYAGHGIQVEGENYLLPVDAKIEAEADVRWEAVPLGELLEGIRSAGGGLNMVVLDACRDNPYQGVSRSGTRGLTREEPRAGTMIMYATEPGRVAADGRGRNGVFTGEFIKAIKEAPSENILQSFNRALRRVHDKTEGRQIPWSEGNMLEDFTFVKREDQPESVLAPQPQQRTSGSLELALWTQAEQLNSVQSYQAYLKQFPDGVMSEIAQFKIGELKQRQRLVTEAAEAQRIEQAAAAARSAERKKTDQIERITRRVEQNLAARRLTAPANDNANSQLNELERLDPGNGFVGEGRAQIIRQYTGWIESRLTSRDWQKAEEYLDSLSQVSGSLFEVSRLRARISELRGQDEIRLRNEAEATAQALADVEARQRTAQRLQENQADAVASAKIAERTLQISRNWRRGIQVALNREGYGVGTPDGLWGEKTRVGIGQWQASNDLRQTGYLNQSEYRQLLTELSVEEVEPFELQTRTLTPSPVTVVASTNLDDSFVPQTIRLKGGKFSVGGVAGVTIKPFDISKYEVTVSQFDKFVQETGYRSDAQRSVGGVEGCKTWVTRDSEWQWTKGDAVGFSQTGSHPVTCVSWNDVHSYIDWLNSRTAGEYRLPSEAEWEYAASAGAKGDWSFDGGTSKLCSYGNGADQSTSAELYWSNERCHDGYKRTAPVGKFRVNAYGLHDVHGNVGEWVEDCWHPKINKLPKDGRAWTASCDLKKRVVRGGSWYHSADILHLKHRYWFDKNHRDSATGFRLVKSGTGDR